MIRSYEFIAIDKYCLVRPNVKATLVSIKALNEKGIHYLIVTKIRCAFVESQSSKFRKIVLTNDGSELEMNFGMNKYMERVPLRSAL